MRIGIGYDVHRLMEGRKLVLGGVEIPYIKGLFGHSDADVLLHAVSDAMLGAAGLGDIGAHFPDTDQTYKDVKSIELLKKVKDLIGREGFSVNNVDAVLVAEDPKIGPFSEKMKKNISTVLGTAAPSVNIKATTAEGTGPVGRGEAISAYAVVTLKEN